MDLKMVNIERMIQRNVAAARAIDLAPGKYSASIIAISRVILSQHGK